MKKTMKKAMEADMLGWMILAIIFGIVVLVIIIAASPEFFSKIPLIRNLLGP